MSAWSDLDARACAFALAHRDTTDPFDAYSAGGALKDKTCGEMARYMGRLVGWYLLRGIYMSRL